MKPRADLLRRLVANAGNLADALHGAHALHDMRQMHPAVHADDHAHDADARVVVVDRDALDAGIEPGDTGGERCNHAAAFFQIDADFAAELALHVLGPAQRYRALRLVVRLHAVMAIGGVHHHALFRTDQADDGIARDGMTAFC